MKCIKMLTFIPMDKIEEMENWDPSRINEKKEILAHELTALVHGEEEADKAQNAARALFSGNGDIATMPTTELTADNFTDGKIALLDMLTIAKLAPSRSEAKRLVIQGGILIGDAKAESFSLAFEPKDFEGDGMIVKKGKKVFHRFIVK